MEPVAADAVPSKRPASLFSVYDLDGYENAQLVALALSSRESDRTLAYERLYGRFVAFVRSVALEVVRNKQDADDITQEVFVKLWERLYYDPEPVAPTTHWPAYLAIVARRLGLDAIRRRSVRQRVSAPEEAGYVMADHDSGVNPETLVSRADTRAEVKQLMGRAQLTEIERRALVAWTAGRLGHPAVPDPSLIGVAAQIGTTASRLRAQLHNGRSKMRLAALRESRRRQRHYGMLATEADTLRYAN